MQYGLIDMFTVRIGETKTSLQYLPSFLSDSTVGEMKKRIQGEIFEVCNIPIKPSEYVICSKGKALSDNDRLGDIKTRSLSLSLTDACDLTLKKICRIMKEETATWEY